MLKKYKKKEVLIKNYLLVWEDSHKEHKEKNKVEQLEGLTIIDKVDNID